jgi:hypothetical protein
MRERLIGSVPYVLLYSLLAAYIVALLNGVGAHDVSTNWHVAIGNGDIRLGHGPLTIRVSRSTRLQV